MALNRIRIGAIYTTFLAAPPSGPLPNQPRRLTSGSHYDTNLYDTSDKHPEDDPRALLKDARTKRKPTYNILLTESTGDSVGSILQQWHLHLNSSSFIAYPPSPSRFPSLSYSSRPSFYFSSPRTMMSPRSGHNAPPPLRQGSSLTFLAYHSSDNHYASSYLLLAMPWLPPVDLQSCLSSSLS